MDKFLKLQKDNLYEKTGKLKHRLRSVYCNTYDEDNNLIPEISECDEKQLADMFITSDCIVLEIGARYGSVSCIIDKKLKSNGNLVVVEPDETVWNALEHNKKINDCNFNIVKGFISNKKLSLKKEGYGTYSIEDENSKFSTFTLKDIQCMYNMKFDTLMIDCEGFMETFFDENPQLYDQIKLVIFETDKPHRCNYVKIERCLHNKGFKCLYKEKGLPGFRVYRKSN